MKESKRKKKKTKMFSLVVQNIQNFTNTTLSSFYFDTIKDRLYNEPAGSESRRMAQTVLYEVLKSYTTSIAPFVCHTAEEIYENYKAITPKPESSVFKAGWLDSVSDFILLCGLFKKSFNFFFFFWMHVE